MRHDDNSPADNTQTMRREPRFRRRNVLKKAGMTVGALSIAGCLGEGNGNGSGNNNTDPSSGDSNEIIMGVNFTEGHPTYKLAQEFKERLEAESDSFSVTVRGGGVYGSTEELLEHVRTGSVQAQAAGANPYQEYTPDYSLYLDPWLIEDFDHLLTVLDSEMFQGMYDDLIEEGNMRALGHEAYRSVRHVTANKPIQHPDDIQGVNLRLPEFPNWVTVWEEIGAEITTVAYAELYSALQTGVADASEGGADQVVDDSLYEVQSHYSLTAHSIFTHNVYMNEDFFQGLDESHQDMILEIGAETVDAISDESMQLEEDFLAEAEENGMTIVEDVDRQAFLDAAKPALQGLFSENALLSWEEFQNI